MPPCTQHCVPCHTICPSSEWWLEQCAFKKCLLRFGMSFISHLIPTFEWFDITQTIHLLLQSEKEKKTKQSLRPYQEESTTSRLISEVKPLRAWLVLGLETTWEHQVS